MRHLNGEYARTFNQRHSLVGHLFQRRFHSVLVDTDAYLLEVCRYVELNPVRARLVDRVAEWDWSSFRANTGQVAALPWLAVGDLHGHMLQRDVVNVGDRLAAAQAYERHVHEGLSANPWKDGLRGEIFLGDDAFVARMQACSAIPAAECPEIPLCQRRDAVDRRQRQASAAARAESFRTAYVEQGMTMSQIARQTNLSVSRISRLIARAEKMAR